MMNKNIVIARKRARLLQVFRDFFVQSGYMEVETPILSPFLLPEPAIEIFKTEYINGYHRNLPCYLIPSPEIWMKRLLAQGFGNIFQITRCFRNGESVGILHNPEFTMCEWYSVDADYMRSLAFTEEFFLYCAQNIDFDLSIDITPPFLKMSMKDAFQEYLNVDLDEILTNPERKLALCKKLNIMVTETSTQEELFNKLFLTYVEPCLPMHKPVVLYDYPACIPTCAKKKDSGFYYERWELYISGNEVANSYSEETNRVVLEEYISKEAERKKTACVVHMIDEEFHTLFDPQFPACSGVALGVDRFFMTITGINSIQGVILFPFSSIIENK